MYPEAILDRWQKIALKVAEKHKKKLMAFRWYGGKYSHLDLIIPLFPPHVHYCEAFGGSAAVLLNKEPSPVETYNDIDGDVVNFFKVLRDKPEELIEKLYLTPFSKEEFIKAWEQRGNRNLSDVERARLFFVRAEQVRTGLAQKATPGRWAWCKLTSRRNMSGAVSRWLSRIENLWLVAERLRSVQIENDDALAVIERYDSPETLFYLDPPYPHDSRSDKNAYAYEMDEDDHVKLAELLHRVEGKVILSGYKSRLMDELYGDWNCIIAPPKTIHSSKAKRREVVWFNYSVQDIPNAKHLLRELESRGYELCLTM